MSKGNYWESKENPESRPDGENPEGENPHADGGSTTTMIATGEDTSASDSIVPEGQETPEVDQSDAATFNHNQFSTDLSEEMQEAKPSDDAVLTQEWLSGEPKWVEPVEDADPAVPVDVIREGYFVVLGDGERVPPEAHGSVGVVMNARVELRVNSMGRRYEYQDEDALFSVRLRGGPNSGVELANLTREDFTRWAHDRGQLGI